MGILCGKCEEGVCGIITEMKISEYSSTKFKWISLMAILCVVFGHCAQGQVMQRLVPYFCYWHVPWFFFLSGMLLALSLTRYAVHELIGRKVGSLVIPYFVWTLLAWLLTGMRSENICQILGLSTAFPSGNPHLWYLHCLIVFCMTLLVLEFFWRRLIRWGHLIAIMCWGIFFGGAILLKFSVIFGTPTSPWYFLLGYVLAKNCLALEDGKEKRRWNLGFFLGAFVVFAAVKTFVILCPAYERNGLLRMVSVVAQIGVIWLGYDALFSRTKMCFPKCLDVVFFVYCFHGMLLVWLSGVSFMNGFLFAVTAIFSFVVANVMRRLGGKGYKVLTGGRLYTNLDCPAGGGC